MVRFPSTHAWRFERFSGSSTVHHERYPKYVKMRDSVLYWFLLTIYHCMSMIHASRLLRDECPSIDKQPRRSQHAQARRQGFAGLDRARNAAARQKHRGKQREFHAVGLAFRDAVASQAVLWGRERLAIARPRDTRGTRKTHQEADSQTGGDAGHRTCADIARHSTDRGERGEDVCGCFAGLMRWSQIQLDRLSKGGDGALTMVYKMWLVVGELCQ